MQQAAAGLTLWTERTTIDADDVSSGDLGEQDRQKDHYMAAGLLLVVDAEWQIRERTGAWAPRCEGLARNPRVSGIVHRRSTGIVHALREIQAGAGGGAREATPRMGQPRLSEWPVCPANSGEYLRFILPTDLLSLGPRPPWSPGQAGRFAAGVELFYLEIAGQSLKTRDLALAQRWHFHSRWGRRAEDPFRGLRAGPVRDSPLFLSSNGGSEFSPRHCLPKTFPTDQKKTGEACARGSRIGRRELVIRP